MNIFIAFVSSALIIPILFIYMNYENNFKLLFLKNWSIWLLYGLIYGTISSCLTYLILNENIFTNLIPHEILGKAYLIALFIGIGIKKLLSVLSFEIKNKEMFVRALPKFIDDSTTRRMNDAINTHYHSKALAITDLTKKNKIHNIDPIIEDSLPIQLTKEKKKKHLAEFKVLKSNESKLMLLGYAFGDNVFAICEAKINQQLQPKRVNP